MTTIPMPVAEITQAPLPEPAHVPPATDHVVVWIFQNNKRFRMHVYGPYEKAEARRVQRDFENKAREKQQSQFVATYVRKIQYEADV